MKLQQSLPRLIRGNAACKRKFQRRVAMCPESLYCGLSRSVAKRGTMWRDPSRGGSTAKALKFNRPRRIRVAHWRTESQRDICFTWSRKRGARERATGVRDEMVKYRIFTFQRGLNLLFAYHSTLPCTLSFRERARPSGRSRSFFSARRFLIDSMAIPSVATGQWAAYSADIGYECKAGSTTPAVNQKLQLVSDAIGTFSAIEWFKSSVAVV